MTRAKTETNIIYLQASSRRPIKPWSRSRRNRRFHLLLTVLALTFTSSLALALIMIPNRAARSLDNPAVSGHQQRLNRPTTSAYLSPTAHNPKLASLNGGAEQDPADLTINQISGELEETDVFLSRLSHEVYSGLRPAAEVVRMLTPIDQRLRREIRALSLAGDPTSKELQVKIAKLVNVQETLDYLRMHDQYQIPHVKPSRFGLAQQNIPSNERGDHLVSITLLNPAPALQ